MKTYIRRQQHKKKKKKKKKKFKHQDIKRKEPPKKYRLGTISNTKLLAGLNRFYMAITSPSASTGSLSWPSLTQTENLTGKSFKWALTTDISSVSVSR